MNKIPWFITKFFILPVLTFFSLSLYLYYLLFTAHDWNNCVLFFVSFNFLFRCKKEIHFDLHSQKFVTAFRDSIFFFNVLRTLFLSFPLLAAKCGVPLFLRVRNLILPSLCDATAKVNQIAESQLCGNAQLPLEQHLEFYWIIRCWYEKWIIKLFWYSSFHLA